MPAYLLDTNILSDIMRNPEGGAARTFERKAFEPDTSLLTSVIVACEVRFGIAKKKSAALSRAADWVLASVEVVALLPGVDDTYAEIRVDLEQRGQPISQNDMLIAAHALALGAVLVTDNVREFKRVKGLKVENWLRL